MIAWLVVAVYVALVWLVLLVIRDAHPHRKPPQQTSQLRRRQLERLITESRGVRWRTK